MRIHNANIGYFTPGTVNQESLQTPFSGMSGLAYRGFRNGMSGMLYRGIGEFTPGCFAVPQNPVSDGNPGLSGLGCACNTDAPQGYGRMLGGMGDVSSFFSSLTSGDWQGAAFNSDFVTGLPNIVLLAGAAYVVMSLIDDTKRGVARVRQAPQAVRRRVGAARSAYKAALAGAA